MPKSSATKLGSDTGNSTAGDATARMENGQIVIRIDASLIKYAAETATFASDPETGEKIFRVIDAEKFAQIVCRELNDDTAEIGFTRIMALLDHYIDKAVEDGSECCQFRFKGKWG